MNVKVNKMVAANLAEQLRERYGVVYDQLDIMSESPVFNEQFIKVDILKISCFYSRCAPLYTPPPALFCRFVSC